MDLEISRSNLRELRKEDRPRLELEAGQARMELEAFGITANNITYAVMGDLMRYWEFFPPAQDAEHWGRVPVWGFATAVESQSSELPEGSRVFGYFPMASELVVSVGRVDEQGFTDMAEHRSSLPTVYNRYAFVDGDPVYRPEREGEIILLRPLFVTSFTIDDFIADNEFFGAATVVISSASSKTAIAAAFLLAERDGIEVVGLTSEANLAFTSSLSCYHRVLTYDQIDQLSSVPTVYVDVAGRRDVTRKVHEFLGEQLTYSMIVGDTHWEAEDLDAGTLIGPKPTLLFAPVQIAKRRTDWGRKGFEEKVAEAWHRFVEFTDGWMQVVEVDGVDGIVSTYLDVLEGRIDPRVGHVCRFS